MPQFITFKLKNDDFALDVTRVREVLDLTNVEIKQIPGSPDHMKGIINVRGTVIPVVDLRNKFGLPEGEVTLNSRIVILELSIEDSISLLGVITDSIHDVMELDPSQVNESPKIGDSCQSEFVKGIGKIDEQLFIILDIDNIFSTDDVIHFRKNVSESYILAEQV